MKALKLLFFIFLIFYSCSGETGKEKIRKKIAFIFSFTEQEVGYKKMLHLTLEQLSHEGVIPETDLFFLDCERYNDAAEQERIREHLEGLQDWKADIIMVCKDQATYALLKCGHPFTREVPIVFTSVNFPNTSLLEEYKGEAVYGLTDIPDIRNNVEFIHSLLGQPPHVAMNYEANYLGRKSYDLLRQQVATEQIVILKNKKSSYIKEKDYDQVVPFLEENGHVVTESFKSQFQENWYIELLPFRYWGTMGVMTKFSSYASENPMVFLLDKYDLMATSICRFFQVPVFSCVRNGFGENINIVGGYFASDEITAKAWANRAAVLLHGGIPEGERYQELPKEYLLDYHQFKRFDSLKLNRVSGQVGFINMPWYVRYRTLLYSLGGISGVGIILLIFVHFYMRRKVKEKDRLLKRLEKMHEQITLSITGGDISLWSNIDGQILFDSNFGTISGLDRIEFSYEEFNVFIHPDDYTIRIEAYKMASRIARENSGKGVLLPKKMQITSFRYRLCFDGSGNYEWYHVNCCVTRDSHGKEILAGVLQNIQQIVEHENKLIQAKELAEQAELKQSFLANMSHEIRTPLNAVIGFTNLLVDPELSQSFNTEEKQEMINTVNQNSELLLKLINDVLEISRVESGYTQMVIEDTDILKVVREIYNTHSVIIKKDLDFRLCIEDIPSVSVRLDKLRFIQVISNFLSNANKFTQAGSITLGIDLRGEQHEIGVYVEDTGVGMSKEHQLVIFDRFYKADEFAQGTGLGLSICKIIMDKMGGYIELDSEPGKGSCFTAVLPLSEHK